MNTKLLLNCKQTSALADRFHEKQLGLLDKWRVKIHLNICDSCRNYYVQSELLKVELGRFIANLQVKPSFKLSEEKKKEMETTIINQIL
jgi:predicted anti-sigma-YlaC factor YlaD